MAVRLASLACCVLLAHSLPLFDPNGAATGTTLALTFNENQRFAAITTSDAVIRGADGFAVTRIEARLQPVLDAQEGLAAAVRHYGCACLLASIIGLECGLLPTQLRQITHSSSRLAPVIMLLPLL